MIVAIVGSRSLKIDDFSEYLPENTTEIVSGGAVGIDTCAARYAKKHGIRLTEIRPDYDNYGRSAPLRRNCEIVKTADLVLVFWDGVSRGSSFVVRECERTGTEYRIFRF